MIKELKYENLPKNERYFSITYETGKKREEHEKLWDEIRDNGKFVKNEFATDFIVSTYEYNNKFYQLWFNDNYGYNDCIKEYEI